MNIALLARVSTQEQAINGHSIGEQIERMHDYCKAMNWTVYKEYIDAGYSGANTDRPALQRMIKDIKAGKIDKVLVYKLDRLSRSQKDTLELIEDVFLANGCDFVSMSENFDTSTPFGRAMIGILAVFAQLEREQIKERMAMGMLARAKKGKYSGSDKLPIGYDYIDGELVVNEFEKMQIIQVFEMYASGMSSRSIADKLNESGQYHKGGIWHHQTIRNLIEKKTYIGYIKHSGEWYKGTHDAIISEELFNKCQDIRTQRKEQALVYNRRIGKANSYLGGFLFCGKCTARMAKFISGEKPYRNSFYVCNSRAKRDKSAVKDPTCKNKRWKMDELDEIVFGEIKKLALDPNYYEEIKENQPIDERPSIIGKEIKKLDDQLSRLMDLYSLGDMSVDILQDKIHDLNDQKIKLEQELESIELEKKNKMSHEETVRIVQSFGEILEENDFDKIRAVISALIEKIVVDDDDITIHWNFA